MRLFVAVAGVHFVGSMGLVLYVFGAGMTRFDTGMAPTATDTLANALLTLVSLPVLVSLEWLPLRFPGVLGYIPFILNASLWGLAAVAIRRRLSTWPRRPDDGGS